MNIFSINRSPAVAIVCLFIGITLSELIGDASHVLSQALPVLLYLIYIAFRVFQKDREADKTVIDQVVEKDKVIKAEKVRYPENSWN